MGESAVGGGAERDLSSFMLSSFSLATFQEQKENIDDFEDNFGSVEISPFLVEEESQGKGSSQSSEGDRALQALVQDFREAQSVNGKRSSCRKEGSAAKPAASAAKATVATVGSACAAATVCDKAAAVASESSATARKAQGSIAQTATATAAENTAALEHAFFQGEHAVSIISQNPYDLWTQGERCGKWTQGERVAEAMQEPLHRPSLGELEVELPEVKDKHGSESVLNLLSDTMYAGTEQWRGKLPRRKTTAELQPDKHCTRALLVADEYDVGVIAVGLFARVGSSCVDMCVCAGRFGRLERVSTTSLGCEFGANYCERAAVFGAVLVPSAFRYDAQANPFQLLLVSALEPTVTLADLLTTAANISPAGTPSIWDE